MKTRELATMLRKTADYLDSLEEFKTGTSITFLEDYSTKKTRVYGSFYDKDEFVAAVKAIGNATKRYDDSSTYPELHVTAKAFPIEFNISRDKVCKKIVTYDCEPLFSEEEVEAL